MTRNYKDVQQEVFSEKFKEFLEKDLVQDLYEMERFRRNSLWEIAIIYLVGIVIVLCFIVTAYFHKGIEGALTILLVLVFKGPIPFLLLLPGCVLYTYKDTTKKKFLPKLISYVGNLKRSRVWGKEYKNYVESLEIIPYFCRFSCDDHFKGNYNGVDFTVSEICLPYQYSSKNKKSRNKGLHHHIFRGLLISFKSFKEFNHNVLIKPDNKWFKSSRSKTQKNERINLEDPEFEELFDVYGNDQIEARYLITPAFMNRMVQLSKKPFANGIFASFEKGMVNIFVPSKKNWFEPPPITKTITEVEVRAALLELLSLFSIVDTLKIDQDIGM